MAVEKPQVAALRSEVMQRDLFKAMAKGQQKAIVKRGDFEFYNARRPHQTHHWQTPDMVYFAALPALKEAA